MRYLFITLVAAFCFFSVSCHKDSTPGNNNNNNPPHVTADTSICGRYAGETHYWSVDIAPPGYASIVTDTTYVDTMIITNIGDTAFLVKSPNIDNGKMNWAAIKYDVGNVYQWSTDHGVERKNLQYYPAGDSLMNLFEFGEGATEIVRFSGKRI